MKLKFIILSILMPLMANAAITNEFQRVLINSTFQFKGGTPGANKVLTSDAVGNYTPQSLIALDATIVTNITLSGIPYIAVTGQGSHTITLTGVGTVLTNNASTATLGALSVTSLNGKTPINLITNLSSTTLTITGQGGSTLNLETVTSPVNITNITSSTITVTGQGTKIINLEFAGGAAALTNGGNLFLLSSTNRFLAPVTVSNIVVLESSRVGAVGGTTNMIRDITGVSLRDSVNPGVGGNYQLRVFGEDVFILDNTSITLGNNSVDSYILPGITETRASGHNLNLGQLMGGPSGAITNSTGFVFTDGVLGTAASTWTNNGATTTSNITLRGTLTMSGVQPVWNLGVFTNVNMVANGNTIAFVGAYATNVMADFPSLLTLQNADLVYPVPSFVNTNMVTAIGRPSSQTPGLIVSSISSNGFVVLRAVNASSGTIDQGNLAYKIQINVTPQTTY